MSLKRSLPIIQPLNSWQHPTRYETGLLIAAMLEKALAEMRFCVENYATSRPSVREWANPSRNHQVDPSIGAITLDAYRAWNEVVVLSGRYSVCYTRITRYSLLHTYSLLTALTIYCPSHSLLTIHYSLLTTHYLLLTTHDSLLTTHCHPHEAHHPPAHCPDQQMMSELFTSAKA